MNFIREHLAASIVIAAGAVGTAIAILILNWAVMVQ